MWDFKVLIETFLFYSYDLVTTALFNFFNTLTVYYYNGFKLFTLKYTFVFNSSLIFGFKFLLMIAFLILIRGGTPRYRYDYLTKLGWLKFIGLLILFFFTALLTFYVY